MRQFTHLCRNLDEFHRADDRQAVLEDYLRRVAVEDAVWAVWFLWGNRLRLHITSRRLLQWATDPASWPEWLIETCQAQVGDVAETAVLLLPLDPGSGTNRPLHAVVEDHLLPLKHWAGPFQFRLLEQFWPSLNRDQALVISKMLTGSCRFGVSRPLLIRALSRCLDVPVEMLAHRLTEKWHPTREFFRSLADPFVNRQVATNLQKSPTLSMLLEDLADDPQSGNTGRLRHKVSLVLVYAQAGQGQEAGLFSHFTLAARDDHGGLVPVARTGAGLTASEYREIDRWIRDNAVARRGPVRTVPPELVFEVGFAGLRPSIRHKAGFLMRFPRVLTWLRDAHPTAVATLEALRRLLDA